MIPRIVDCFSEATRSSRSPTPSTWTRSGRIPFEGPRRPAPFDGAGDVTMMRVEGDFEHADGAIRLPYRDSDLRFVAMLGDWREREWRARLRHGRAAALHHHQPRSSWPSR